MLVRKLLFVLIVCVLIANSEESFAGCSSAGQVSAVEYNLAQLIKVSHANTTSSINTTILTVGRALEETLKQGQAQDENTFKSLEESLKTLFQRQHITEGNKRIKTEYGEPASVRGACDEAIVATSTQDLDTATAQIREGLDRENRHYANSRLSGGQNIARLVGINEEDVTLTPPGGTATNEQIIETAKAIRSIVNPVPNLPLTPAQKQSTSGNRYEAHRKLVSLKTGIVASTLNGHLAMIAAKKGDSDGKGLVNNVRRLHREYGYLGEPEQVVDGSISLWGLFDFYAKLRPNSLEWNKDVRIRKDTKFLLREQTAMQAWMLRLQWQAFQEEQRQSALLAVLVSHLVGQEKTALNAQYKQALEAR